MSQTPAQKSLIAKAKASSWTNAEIKSLEGAFAAPATAKPTFRDWVELGITGALGLAFLIALYYVFTQIGKVPTVYPVGDEKRVVEPLQQALMAIAIVTPFLTTIVGFWFGKSSGSDVAKKETERADKAVKDKEVVEETAKAAEKEKTDFNGKLENIQGTLNGVKAVEQELGNQAAKAIAGEIAKENDQSHIRNIIAGTRWKNADTAYLANEVRESEVVKHLTPLEERGSEVIFNAIQNALDQ
ncbi:MAG: hypothetical protein GY928_28255 [Colwellia sp.]|nr:hypothetical protein [Colwellia sp.]